MRALIGLFCFKVGFLLAQQPTFIATIEHDTIGLDDAVEVVFTLLDDDASHIKPVFNDQWVTVMGGPSVSSHISVINGSVNRKKTWTYTLQPKQVAEFADIGYATVQVNGETIESNHLSLTIVEGSVVVPKAIQTHMDDFFRMPFPQFSFPDFWGMPQQTQPRKDKSKRPIYRL